MYFIVGLWIEKHYVICTGTCYLLCWNATHATIAITADKLWVEEFMANVKFADLKALLHSSKN